MWVYFNTPTEDQLFNNHLCNNPFSNLIFIKSRDTVYVTVWCGDDEEYMIVGLIFFSPHFLAHKKKTISLQHFQLSSPETYKERLGKEIMCERASVSDLIADPF